MDANTELKPQDLLKEILKKKQKKKNQKQNIILSKKYLE